MRRVIIPVVASALALAIPTAAQAWPGPVPGQPACIPNGDGTFVIVPNAQPPFPRGSHQPENGACEGPVRPPAPTPAPIPTPTPPAPVPPTPQPPTPPNCGPGTDCCPVCVSHRKIRITLAKRVRTSPRTSREVRYSRVRSATMTWLYGSQKTTLRRDKRGRLTGVANFDVAGGTTAVIGQVFTVRITARVAGHKRPVHIVRIYRLCMKDDGDLNQPTDQRRD